MSHQKWNIIIGIFGALVFTFVFFFASDLIPEKGAWYSSSFAHRYQTDAFLKGGLSLLPGTPLQLDYVLYDGAPHQVWGLGAPLMRLPFEILAKASGYSMFPDRITAAFYFLIFGLCIYFLTSFLLQNSKKPFRSFSIACISIITTFCVMFFMPLFSLARTRFAVYEETVFYGVIVSIFLLALVFIINSYSKRIPIWLISILIFLIGLTPLIRPTLIVYSVVTLGLILWHFRDSKKLITLYILVFALGVGTVGATNYLRFEKFSEFGHGLNVDYDYINNHQLKFYAPFNSKNVAVSDAAKELVGTIFFNKLRNGSNFSDGLVLWQNDAIRFRNFYSFIFNPFHLGLVIMSLLFGIYFIYSKLQKNKNASLLITLYWGLGSFILMFLFYLYSPSLSSRYLVDFSGSIIALMVFWIVYSGDFFDKKHWKYLFSSLIILVFFSVCALSVSKEFFKFQTPSRTLSYENAMTEGYTNQPTYLESDGEYRIGEVITQYESFSNGTGWDIETGNTNSNILLFMRNIGDIEIEFEGICEKIRESSIKAKIGNSYLTPTKKIDPNTNNQIFKFEVPERFRGGNPWPVFIKLFDLINPDEMEEDCRLIRVSWQKLEKYR